MILTLGSSRWAASHSVEMRGSSDGVVMMDSAFRRTVMAGHSRSKNGVASARLCPAIHIFLDDNKDVDARHRRQVHVVCARQTTMAGHDGCVFGHLLPLR